MADSGSETPAEKFLIDRFGVEGEQTEGDLRGGTIMGDANGAAARVRDLYGIAGLRLAAIGYVARENPRVTVRNPVGGFSIHANSGQPAILA
jgi:hypothetical protein